MAADAGVQGWFRYQELKPAPGAFAGPTSSYTAEEIAISVADANFAPCFATSASSIR